MANVNTFPAVSYGRDTPAGVPGMIASTLPHTIISGVVDAASGNIPAGYATVFTATDGVVKLPTAGGAFAGIAVLDRSLPFEDGGVFKPYSQLSLMKKGSIWVTAKAACVQGDPVYFVPTTGELTNVSSGNTLITGAEWASASAAGAIARIRL